DIDMVVIATRHDSHAELAARALERGKAVLLEKPLAIDAAGLERIEPLLADGGRLVVDFNRDFAPATERVRTHIAKGAGALSLSLRINPGDLEGAWLTDPAQGGGTLIGEGCHWVELSSSLAGAELRTIQAAALGDDGRAGDSFALTLSYADGSLATVTYVTGGPRRMAKERIEVIAGGRGAVIDDFQRVTLYGSGRRAAPLPSRPRGKGHPALMRGG